VLIESDDIKRHELLQNRRHVPCSSQEAIIRDEKTKRSWENIGTDFVTIYNDYTENFQVETLHFLNNVLAEISDMETAR